MVNLTPLQLLGISIAIAGALSTGTVQLTDIFGPHVAKSIASAASLISAVLGGIVTALAGQASIVKSVAAMPGISGIQVNASANQALAQVAMDDDQPKVEAIPAAAAVVEKTAKGA